MSQKIDSRDVLRYLNELGYTNINAQQLKEFIIDLKKLIKYEHRNRKANLENIPIADSRICPNFINRNCCDEPSCPNNRFSPTISKLEENVINSHYEQSTVASKAKEVPRRERQISVHISKANNKEHDHCVHIQKKLKEDTATLQLIERVEMTTDGSNLNVETESTIKSIKPSSEHSSNLKSQKSKVTKSKSTFIKPRSAKPINKSDPVALYHHYQEQWKKQKFPGQETHSDLRWAVREKMLGGPKVDIPRASSSRRRSNSCKG